MFPKVKVTDNTRSALYIFCLISFFCVKDTFFNFFVYLHEFKLEIQIHLQTQIHVHKVQPALTAFPIIIIIIIIATAVYAEGGKQGGKTLHRWQQRGESK